MAENLKNTEWRYDDRLKYNLHPTPSGILRGGFTYFFTPEKILLGGKRDEPANR